MLSYRCGRREAEIPSYLVQQHHPVAHADIMAMLRVRAGDFAAISRFAARDIAATPRPHTVISP
jgi:hypothetical protein